MKTHSLVYSNLGRSTETLRRDEVRYSSGCPEIEQILDSVKVEKERIAAVPAEELMREIWKQKSCRNGGDLSCYGERNGLHS